MSLAAQVEELEQELSEAMYSIRQLQEKVDDLENDVFDRDETIKELSNELQYYKATFTDGEAAYAAYQRLGGGS